jgi:hypothetical protein
MKVKKTSKCRVGFCEHGKEKSMSMASGSLIGRSVEALASASTGSRSVNAKSVVALLSVKVWYKYYFIGI